MKERPKIPVGKYDIDDRRNVPPYGKQAPEYDPAELARGIEIEREHVDLYNHLKQLYPGLTMTLDEFAEWITKAHLRELKDYNTRLDKMEDAAKGK